MKYLLLLIVSMVCLTHATSQSLFQPTYLHQLDSALKSGIAYVETHFAYQQHLSDVSSYAADLKTLSFQDSSSLAHFRDSLAYTQLFQQEMLDLMAHQFALFNSRSEKDAFQQSFSLFKKGHIEAAINLLKTEYKPAPGIKASAKQRQAFVFLADLQLLSFNFGEAELLYITLLAEQASDPELLWKLAHLYKVQSRYELSKLYLHKGLQLVQADDWRHGLFLQALSRLQAQLGEKDEAFINLKKAIEHWLQQKQQYPDNLAIDFFMARCHQIIEMIGHYPDFKPKINNQITIWRDCLKKHPQNSFVKIQLAHSYEQLAQYSGSLKEDSITAANFSAIWKDLYTDHPQSTTVLVGLAMSFSMNERDLMHSSDHSPKVYEQRQAKLIKALEKTNPSPYILYLVLADYIATMEVDGHGMEVFPAYHKIIQVGESILNIRPYYRNIIRCLDEYYKDLGWYYRANHDFQKSIDYHWKRIQMVDHKVFNAHLKKILDYTGIEIEAYFEIGKALYELNDARKAIDFSTSALELLKTPGYDNPHILVKVHTSIGHAHRKLLEKDLAMEHYQAAKKIYEELLKNPNYSHLEDDYDKLLKNIETLQE